MSKSRFFQQEKEKEKEKGKKMRVKRQFNRQQTVRCLPLPYDVTEIINSFLFYDLLTAKTRRLKKLICKKFKNAINSRACPDKYWFLKQGNNPDNCENWFISLTDKNLFGKNCYNNDDLDMISKFTEKTIHAVNCGSCGNYKYSTSSGYYRHRLIDALSLDDLELATQIRSRMPDSLRCECNLFWWI
jgi:Zn ribbon nucleic-acid-binding protein